MYTESSVKPEFKEEFPDLIRINFDVTEDEREDPQTEEKYTVYCFQSVEVSPSADYSTIVEKIVRSKHSQSQVEAIQLNNAVESPTEEHKAQLTELQAWRTHAKEVAKEVLGMD